MREKYVYAERSDGLGSRLREVLIGMLLSDVLQRDFRFYWPSARNVFDQEQEDAFAPELIFSKPFLSQHLTASSLRGTVTRLHKWPIGRIQACYLSKLGPKGIEAKNAHKVQNSFSFMENRVYRERLRDTFARIGLSHQAGMAYRSGYDSVPKNSVGIHLRQADIVHGAYRYCATVWAEKAIPIFVCKCIMEKILQSGDTPVVVSGDKRALMWLENSGLHVMNYPDPPDKVYPRWIWEMFFDIGRLAACKKNCDGG